jgi:hypothetical protein
MIVRVFRWTGILVGLVVAAGLGYVAVLAIQGANAVGTGDLTNEAQLRKALDTMPYPYTLRQTRYAGVDQAYAGQITARWSSIDFSVSICGQGSNGCPVPEVPRASGVTGAVGYGHVSVRSNAASGGQPGHKSGIGLDAALNAVICHATGQDEYGCV